MPKISYTPKAKEGFDDAGVTALQIEQKIAEIQTLLRGMIDEDNLLAYDEDATTTNISPAVIRDIPLDTNPVNHCMKFFGFVDRDDSIVTKLYDSIMDYTEANPSLFTVGGIQDTEMIWQFEQGIAEEGEYEVNKFKNLTGTIIKTAEIPSNFVPITWGELWELVKEIEIKKTLVDDVRFVVSGKITSLSNFLSDFNVSEDEYVTFFQINKVLSGTLQEDGLIESLKFKSVSLPFLNFYEGNNQAIWTARFETEQIVEEAYCLVRFIPAVLCKVLP